ncbi:GNAT family N-acetyltransferase [Nonomuraea endophytica]|uniref:GNAT superfamily N-acetyltransferase n=1 Tax=Nonomuraea endophytica TaxID=714136 RepID=A0A7W8A4S4_9ACTN|nr:GNAT family N-acetyltransferase [Nonomuraea endophytica]MBB5079576.1 GNAT superfamily N-acetyltransferase [Nonomuraea endophytica]
MQYKIQGTPSAEVSAEQAETWHGVIAASLGHDLPGQPVPTRAQLTVPPLHSRRLVWMAAEPGGPVAGVASLRLFDAPGMDHLSELDLHVRPELRRGGAGSLLLAAAVAAARAEGRRAMITAVAAGGPGDAFCAARGLRRVLTLRHLLLDLAQADCREADTARPGYDLAFWTGTVPDGLADAFAEAKNAMNDMPTGEMDYGARRWDAAAVREMAKVLADRRDTLLTLAALHGETMAGYTEIVIRSGERRRAAQYDTAVVPAHRGHGLGLWLKATMVRRLRVEHPDLAEVETDTAEDNVHMLAVNERLGYRAHRSTHEYQFDL